MRLAVYLDLDGALDPAALGLSARDARGWGPRLRGSARRLDMHAFTREVVSGLPPFVVYGSGDFHHLTAARLRTLPPSPLTLVSFDNHPDWDVRPPYWGCGGWMKRAIELPHVRRAIVWGCGNFELNWPARLFAKRGVEVRAWTERYPSRGHLTIDTWRPAFDAFAESMRGQDVYVTVDIDCLRREDAVTNWENGLFAATDVAWALDRLRSFARVIAGDVCGAYSTPVYARTAQRIAAAWDHPAMEIPDEAYARAINTGSLRLIWPALTTSTPARSPR